jgi:Domain of unknown function (DUF4259)
VGDNVATWDVGPFDNDTAADWSATFDEADDATRLEMLEETLTAAADETEYLEADAAFEALAAAAVVASQLGGPAIDSTYGPDFLNGPVQLRIPKSMPDLAVRALDRIVADDSGWRDMWDDEDQLDNAIATLAPIREALARQPS